MLDVNVCGRNLTSQNDIYLDLEDDDSFDSFENKISLFNKPLRLVINTSGFLHSNHLSEIVVLFLKLFLQKYYYHHHKQ